MERLEPNRHDRGWPRLTLLMWTSLSSQTFRLYVHALGTVDSHDARGASWEIVQWVPMTEPGAAFRVAQGSYSLA